MVLGGMTLGLMVLALIGGIGGIWLYAGRTGANPGILKTLGIGGGTGGVVATITGIYTKSWAIITGAFYGHLGIVGYAFIFVLAVCLIVWIWNAYQDYKKNRPIGFID